MTKLFETTFSQAESYKNQAISASEARVGVHPRVEARRQQGEIHDAFKKDIEQSWESFKEIIEK